MTTFQDYVSNHKGKFDTLYYPGAGFDFSPFYLFSLLANTKQTYYTDYSPEMNAAILELGNCGWMENPHNGNNGNNVFPLAYPIHRFLNHGHLNPQDFGAEAWDNFFMGNRNETDYVKYGAYLDLDFNLASLYNGIPEHPCKIRDNYHQPLPHGFNKKEQNWVYQRISRANLEHLGIDIYSVGNDFYYVMPARLKFEWHHLGAYLEFKNDSTSISHSNRDTRRFNYLGTDGIGTVPVLLANGIVPDVVVVQEHGTGGNYAHFGYRQGDTNAFYDQFGANLPNYIFTDPTRNDILWPGYEQVTDVIDLVNPIINDFILPQAFCNPNPRALFKRIM